MAAKSTPMSHEETVNAVMAQLRAPSTPKRSIVDRLADYAIDEVASTGEYVARLGAAAGAAVDNFNDSYQLEVERQLRRRAERLIARTQH
jgi:hypothetical protein